MIKTKLINDLTGKIFGKLIVLKVDEEKSKKTKRIYYICQCSCEKKTIKSVRQDALVSGNVQSCGCIHNVNMGKKCKIKNCNNNAEFLGLCRKHYDQQYKYGKIFDRTRFDSNEINIKDTYAEIILYNQQNQIKAKTLIDIDDIEKIKNIKWSYDHEYVSHKEQGFKIYLHRLIMDFPNDLYIDHINGNPLDNRKENLRTCKQYQNCMNKHKTTNQYTDIIGVHWRKEKEVWEAVIFENGNRHYLGKSKNINDVIKLRKEAEQKYYGEYAPKN